MSSLLHRGCVFLGVPVYKMSREFHGEGAIDDLCKESLRKVVTDMILTANVRMRTQWCCTNLYAIWRNL